MELILYDMQLIGSCVIIKKTKAVRSSSVYVKVRDQPSVGRLKNSQEVVQHLVAFAANGD